MRVTRTSMIEVLRPDYIAFAEAKGLSPRRVLLRHALKNALIPTVTVAAIETGSLLGGNMIVETVFGWPGLGRLVVESIFARNYPLVQAAVLLYAVTYVLLNFAGRPALHRAQSAGASCERDRGRRRRSRRARLSPAASAWRSFLLGPHLRASPAAASDRALRADGGVRAPGSRRTIPTTPICCAGFSRRPGWRAASGPTCSAAMRSAATSFRA